MVRRLSILVASTHATACLDTCFAPGTRVLTPDGHRPVDALRAGDVVLSWCHATEEVVARRVVAIHCARVREVRRMGVVVDGAPVADLVATPSHPIWLPSRGVYVPLRDLREGDDLAIRKDGSLVRARVGRIVADERPTAAFEVFNLTVEAPTSNYFAEGILVHNKEAPTCEDIATVVSAAVAAGPNAPTHRVSVTAPSAIRVTEVVVASVVRAATGETVYSNGPEPRRPSSRAPIRGRGTSTSCCHRIRRPRWS